MYFLQLVLKIAFYVTIGTVLSIAGVAIFFMSWEPDRSIYPVRGIDVSHHQGPINWANVATDDVAFVYMKASEGGDFQDRSFSANWSGAGEAGLARGAYHFFSLCRPGELQADNFLGVLPRGEAMLPPVLDIEFEGNCASRPAISDVHKEVSAFVAKVETATGHRVMLYAPGDAYETYLANQGLTRPLWVRSMWRSPDYAGDWTVWQFHQRGSVAGITGDVDLNVLAAGMTLDQLMR
ncbi:GH25 family lysozyme [Roseibium sp.]|uniref:glycoside hydrolase family 25 protein n=1 Tax=Roseibium sp. TaxID=1936156 RepID=UPI003A983563